MSKKTQHQNPYREGSRYHFIFDQLRKRGSGATAVPRSTLVQLTMDEFGISESASNSAVGVVLSPRKEGESRGDCRGNMSAQGHIYFVMPKVDKEDPRKVKGYSLRWRETPLELLKRVQHEVAQKTSKNERQSEKVEAVEAVGTEQGEAVEA